MNRKILIAVIMVSLLCTMAGIGTMAWFTSSAASAGNSFESGTLTLGGIIGEEDIANQFATLTFTNMSPGGEPTLMGSTTLKNLGSLPFYLYRITASNFVDDNPNNNVNDLSLDEVLMLDIYIAEEQVYHGRLSELAAENGGYFDPIYGIQPDETAEMVIMAYMDGNAGNMYQGLSMSADLTIYASQAEKPIAGQPVLNPALLGSTEQYNVYGYNLSKNGQAMISFRWEWLENEELAALVSQGKEMTVEIKHEAGVNDAVVRAFFQHGRLIELEGLTASDVKVTGESISIYRSALPSDWETISVSFSGGKHEFYDEITYQHWYLP